MTNGIKCFLQVYKYILYCRQTTSFNTFTNVVCKWYKWDILWTYFTVLFHFNHMEVFPSRLVSEAFVSQFNNCFFYPNLLLNVFRYFWNVWRYFDSRPIYIYKHFNILFTRRIAEYKPFVQTHYFINYSKNTQWPHVEENTIWTFVKLASSPNIFLRFNRQLKIWHSFHMKVRV